MNVAPTAFNVNDYQFVQVKPGFWNYGQIKAIQIAIDANGAQQNIYQVETFVPGQGTQVIPVAESGIALADHFGMLVGPPSPTLAAAQKQIFPYLGFV